MVSIQKVDGTTEPFDGSKLETSLRRVGAGEHTTKRIRETIERTLVPGTTTHEVYKRAFTLLRKEARHIAARYSLRRALFEFGPSGHPFEDFVSQLFIAEGWKVEWRSLLPGKCVMHEVDVYAEKEGKYLAAELKYHNDPQYKTDVKVALYVKARFDDIASCDPSVSNACRVDEGYLITNTKFTDQAIQYARCVGMGLIGWSYPTEGNLYDRIMSAGIFPITALTTLKKAEKRLLIDKGVVTTNMLKDRKDALREAGISPERMGEILTESASLSNSNVSY